MAFVAVRSWHISEKMFGKMERTLCSFTAYDHRGDCEACPRGIREKRTCAGYLSIGTVWAHARETRQISNPGPKAGRGWFILPDDHVPDWLAGGQVVGTHQGEQIGTDCGSQVGRQ